MADFANAAAFSDPKSRQMATGVDFNQNNAIVDPQGNVLAYAKTGGAMTPQRYELLRGIKLYRFVGLGRSPQEAAKGAWWVEQAEFEKLFSFAQVHDLGIGMAMRMLCLVPPEWNQAIMLIRCRVVRDLLAWRGLGNSVITKAAQSGGLVNMPHQNEISARRLHQLFIPGLLDPRLVPAPLTVENSYPLDAGGSRRGFIYT